MKITKDSFFSVGSDLKIPKEQVEAFWNGLEKWEETPQTTSFTKYLYYFGALIVIAAMTFLMNHSWLRFGGGGLFLIASAYTFVLLLIGFLCWNKKRLRIPAGLLITIAICMVPLAIFGLETYWNIWPRDYPGEYLDFYQWIRASWIYMEIGTILAGLIALYFFPFPFLTVPIFIAFWFLTLDIIPLIFKTGLTKDWITLCFGLVSLAIGFFLDRRKKEDFGFWCYLFGALGFWVALNGLVWDWQRNEAILLIYLAINLLMMGLSIFLRRNVLMILGVLGVFIYLFHLAQDLFKDSIWFPFVLSFIGLAIIYLGVLYQRNMQWIEKKLLEILPSGIRNFLENR